MRGDRKEERKLVGGKVGIISAHRGPMTPHGERNYPPPLNWPSPTIKTKYSACCSDIDKVFYINLYQVVITALRHESWGLLSDFPIKPSTRCRNERGAATMVFATDSKEECKTLT